MLKAAKNRLVDAGAHPHRSYRDETGVWGYRLFIEDESFILVAKQFGHKDNASFLREAVSRATDNGDWLLFYNDAEESYTVFDAEYVQAEGKYSRGQSKTREAEWRELGMKHGVDIIDFTKRREHPHSVDMSQPVGLDKFGVDV